MVVRCMVVTFSLRAGTAVEIQFNVLLPFLPSARRFSRDRHWQL